MASKYAAVETEEFELDIPIDSRQTEPSAGTNLKARAEAAAEAAVPVRSGVSLAQVLAANKEYVPREGTAATSVPTKPSPPLIPIRQEERPHEEHAELFEGDGFSQGGTATARKQVEEDDEFDYAFEGGQREGKAHVQVFKAKALPAHLVTNVKSAVLNAVEENEEMEEGDEEEEEDEPSMIVEEVTAEELAEVAADDASEQQNGEEESQGGADEEGDVSTSLPVGTSYSRVGAGSQARRRSCKSSGMQTGSYSGMDEDDLLAADGSMAGQDGYTMRGLLSTDAQQDMSKALPSGWSTFVASDSMLNASSQPDLQEVEGTSKDGRAPGGAEESAPSQEHGDPDSKAANDARAAGRAPGVEELPSYKLLKALSNEEHKLNAGQQPGGLASAAAAAPVTITQAAQLQQASSFGSHASQSHLPSGSPAAAITAVAGLAHQMAQYASDPDSCTSLQHQRGGQAAGLAMDGHASTSSNASAAPQPARSLSSGRDGTHARRAGSIGDGAAGSGWSQATATPREDHGKRSAPVAATPSMLTLQGSSDAVAAAGAAAMAAVSANSREGHLLGVSALQVLTSAAGGGSLPSSGVQVHHVSLLPTQQSNFVELKAASASKQPQAQSSQAATSASIQPPVGTSKSKPAQPAASASPAVGKPTGRPSPEVDEWEEVTAQRQMELQQQAQAAVAAVPTVTFHEALLHFMAVPIDPAVRAAAEASIAPRPGLFARLLCMGPPDLKPLLREQQIRLLSLARIPFSEEDKVHFQLLCSIYATFTGKSTTPQRYGPHWAEVGFQGADPATDLRSCGILGLLQLAHLHQHEAQNAQKIFTLSHSKAHEFPLAPVSLNITKFMFQAMRKGDLNSSINAAGSAVEVANKFYVGAMYAFYDAWVDGKKTMTESGFVIKAIDQMCQKQPVKMLSGAGATLRDWRPLLGA